VALGCVSAARPRAVLLDALGTLLALVPPAPALAQELRVRHGIELSGAQAERAFHAEIAYYRAHHDEGRDEASLDGLRRRCAAALHAALPAAAAAEISVTQLLPVMLAALRFQVYPDAQPTLALLRTYGLGLVVVSNWDVSLPGVLRAVGLARLLDGVITSADVGAPKPESPIFHAALACAGVSAAQAVHVGDSAVHDVAGALRAGIAPVLLRRAGGSAADAPVTAPVIHSLSELPALVRCAERR
jgi:putative hydrolase of the HAD superfamily